MVGLVWLVRGNAAVRVRRDESAAITPGPPGSNVRTSFALVNRQRDILRALSSSRGRMSEQVERNQTMQQRTVSRQIGRGGTSGYHANYREPPQTTPRQSRSKTSAPERFMIPTPKAGPFTRGPDSKRQANVPRGTVTQHEWRSTIFPGTQRAYWVYVPDQYTPDRPAKPRNGCRVELRRLRLPAGIR